MGLGFSYNFTPILHPGVVQVSGPEIDTFIEILKGDFTNLRSADLSSANPRSGRPKLRQTYARQTTGAELGNFARPGKPTLEQNLRSAETYVGRPKLGRPTLGRPTSGKPYARQTHGRQTYWQTYARQRDLRHKPTLGRPIASKPTLGDLSSADLRWQTYVKQKIKHWYADNLMLFARYRNTRYGLSPVTSCSKSPTNGIARAGPIRWEITTTQVKQDCGAGLAVATLGMWCIKQMINQTCQGVEFKTCKPEDMCQFLS